MSKNIIGILILLIGCILLIRPPIYKRDIWKKGAAAPGIQNNSTSAPAALLPLDFA